MYCINFKLELKFINQDVDVNKQPMVMVTQMTVQFPNEEATYIFPSHLQELAIHEVLSEKALIKAAVKSLNSTSEIGHFRHVNIQDAELFSQYFDEAFNPIFNDYFLEESVPTSEWSNADLLQEMYEKVKNSITEFGKFKIREVVQLFSLNKFDGRNAKEFIIRFEAECQRNGIHENSFIIDILRFFMIDKALLWYESCKKKTDPADWPAWKNNLMTTFETESFLYNEKALDFCSISGLNESTRISMIVDGLPHSINPKLEKNKIATYSELILKPSLFDKSFKTDLNEEAVEDSEFDFNETIEKYENTTKHFSAKPENKKQTNLTDESSENFTKPTYVSADILDLTNEAEHSSNLLKEDHPIVVFTGTDFRLVQDVNQPMVFPTRIDFSSNNLNQQTPTMDINVTARTMDVGKDTNIETKTEPIQEVYHPMVSYTRIDFPSRNLDQKTLNDVDMDLFARTVDVGKIKNMDTKTEQVQDVYHPVVVVTRTDISSRTRKQPNVFDASAKTNSDDVEVFNVHRKFELAEDRYFDQEVSDIIETILRLRSTSLLKRSVLKCKMKRSSRTEIGTY